MLRPSFIESWLAANIAGWSFAPSANDQPSYAAAGMQRRR
ncbi:hypothetical protein I41_48320 [Lacipirellula limnantheis]|uniref:Uncharacterized protein n=1 Tax=Lacipirellula limnantheis TaxID=2528024 RepID=A0A517U4Y2_9BACT|nr:hypothetical protein I41_48320 [Lacipirellula limnantheis]